jgi:hypothetical protein
VKHSSCVSPFALVLSTIVILAGCNAQVSHSGPRVSPEATPAQQAALFEPLTKLEGEWTTIDEKGQTVVASVFKTTAGGSAVREVMFPGTAQEMTNMYHLDGPDLVVTHYCAVGNQPRMRAKAGKPGVLAFTFDDVTNLHDTQGHYMGQLTLTVVDNDTIVEDWRSIVGGQLTDPMRFEMKRKK